MLFHVASCFGVLVTDRLFCCVLITFRIWKKPLWDFVGTGLAHPCCCHTCCGAHRHHTYAALSRFWNRCLSDFWRCWPGILYDYPTRKLAELNHQHFLWPATVQEEMFSTIVSYIYGLDGYYFQNQQHGYNLSVCFYEHYLSYIVVIDRYHITDWMSVSPRNVGVEILTLNVMVIGVGGFGR